MSAKLTGYMVAGIIHNYVSLQVGNTALHVVAGKGNYDALRVFLKTVQLPEINHQNEVYTVLC